MERLISIYAFSKYILVDDNRFLFDDKKSEIHPVLSCGTVIVPLKFFFNTWEIEVHQDQDHIYVKGNGHILSATVGEKEFTIDGVVDGYSVAPRYEKDILCIPAVGTARALGIAAEQFELLVVFGRQKIIDQLKADKKAVDELAKRTCGIYNAALFTSEDFGKARESWRRSLCGDSRINDLSIPGMRKLLDMRDMDSEALRCEMNRNQDAVILFGNEPPTESSDLKLQYDRILRMAQPYGTYGCRGYHNQELLNDILYALDWMYDNMYGADVLSDTSYRSWRKFNWWEWYQGGANPMLDTVMIIEKDISRERVFKYLLPMDFMRTQMRVELNESDALSRIRPLPALALLHEDRALLQALYLDAEMLLEEHDSGNCMRRDWCSMTHGMPYNIGYGITSLIYLAHTLHILEDSPLAFTCRKKYNLMKQIRYTFEPVMYHGQALSMMNGRIMQRDAAQQCAEILLEFYRIFDMFGEEENEELYKIIHRHGISKTKLLTLHSFDTENMTLEEYRKIGIKEEPKTNINAYVRCYHAINDKQYASSDYELGYMWYSGDSCVQFRNDCLVALRMSSERTINYESLNGQNTDAWYTGDGMLYLYTLQDEEQYSEVWWKNVNKYLMPGTTVEDREREAISIIDGYRSHQDFVGGVALKQQFVCATMNLESFHCESDGGKRDEGYGGALPVFNCTLTAMKSYFMFDRAIVAMGCGINASDGFPVRTVIDNRRLTEKMKEIRVNGKKIAYKTFETTRHDIRDIYIPGVACYIFPQGGDITLRLYENGGEMFFSCWFEHGINPIDGSYAYIILPNVTIGEFEEFIWDDDIELLRNDEGVQCVKENHSGLSGIIFRRPEAFEDVEALQPMIMMIKRDGKKVDYSVSEPTQKLESFGFRLGQVDNFDSQDNTESKRFGNRVEVTIKCDSARGRTYTGLYTMN